MKYQQFSILLLIWLKLLPKSKVYISHGNCCLISVIIEGGSIKTVIPPSYHLRNWLSITFQEKAQISFNLRNRMLAKGRGVISVAPLPPPPAAAAVVVVMIIFIWGSGDEI